MAQKPDPLAWDSVGPQKRAPHLLADHDENLVTIAQEIPDPPSVYSGDTRGKHAQRSQWGNVFNVQAGATAVGVLTPALTTPHLDSEQDLTLLLQVQPQNPFFPYYIVAAQITYGVGAAVLTKTVYLHNANLVRVQLCARNVQVSLQVLQTTHFMSIPVSGDVNVTCAVVPGHTYLRDGYTWSPGNTITLTAFGDLWPANGTLGVQQYPTYGSVGLLTATLTAASSPGSPLLRAPFRHGIGAHRARHDGADPIRVLARALQRGRFGHVLGARSARSVDVHERFAGDAFDHC